MKINKFPGQSFNLTKSLGFNAYQVLASNSEAGLRDAATYLNQKYDTSFLIDLLEQSASLIGTKILSLSTETYDPVGASVAILLANDGHPGDAQQSSKVLLGHLDKSHITVHTYPQLHPETGLCSLRLDLDLATCGTISPLESLPQLFSKIVCDVVTIDFRIRGYRLSAAKQLDFGSGGTRPILDYLPPGYAKNYHVHTINEPKIRFFHTRLLRKQIDLNNHIMPLDEPADGASLKNLKQHLELLYHG